jgi:hypothetical protein
VQKVQTPKSVVDVGSQLISISVQQNSTEKKHQQQKKQTNKQQNMEKKKKKLSSTYPRLATPGHIKPLQDPDKASYRSSSIKHVTATTKHNG